MKNIFSPEGKLWRILNTVTDIFGLSVIWLFCCLPIVTIGPATTALYDSVVRCIRYQHAGPYKRFFRTFRADLGTSILSTVLWLFVLGFGFWSLALLRAMGEENSSTALMASAAYYVIMVMPCGAACWCFPVLSRFIYKWKDLNLTALKLSVGYLPRSFVLVLLTGQVAVLCVNYIFPVFFAPACLMLLWSLFIEPVFTKLGGGLTKESDEPDPEEPEEEEQ